MRVRRAAALIASLVVVSVGLASPASAQDATWLASPSSGDFNTGANWSTAAVPTGTAFFGTSDTTSLSFSQNPTTVGGWTFNAGASNYTFTNGNVLFFTGAGIVVNGGSAAIINTYGMEFDNTSTAGSATITNNNYLQFSDTSTAGRATITNNSVLNFASRSTAGSATITNNNHLSFSNFSSAGNAVFTNNSVLIFQALSTAGSATITNTGTGLLQFLDYGTGGNARLINNGSSTVIEFFSRGPNSDGRVSAGSIEGNGALILASSEVTVGSNNLSTVFSGQILGSGSLVKTGAGTLTLTSASPSYNGGTTVNGGTLEIDGSIANSSGVTVNASGTLSGAGTVSGTQINAGGTLMPGVANGIGTLTVSGNLAFQSGAIYLVQVTPTAAASTNVTGTATLNGTVVADPLSRLTKTTTYTILTATGLNGTTFSGVTLANNFATSPSLSYSGGNVLLTLGPGLLSPGVPSNANTNQKTLAGAIDNALLGGANLNAGFNTLFGLSGGALTNALTQGTGETATGSQQTSFSAMGQFMGVMTDPFAGRGGGINGSNSAIGYAATSNPTNAFAMFTKAPQSFEQRWSVWASGFGGSQSTSGNAALGSNDTTSRIAGTAVGADYLFSPNSIAGFAMAGGGTNFSVVNGGTGRSDLFQFGGYVRHNEGAAYITAALAYGWQDVTTSRTVTVAGFDQLRAEFNANAWSGRLEGGTRYVAPVFGGLGITPYAAAQFVTLDLPAYAEQAVVGTNNFALSYGARDVTDVRSELGVRTDKSFVQGDGIVTLRGRLAWAHDYDPNRSISATFQSLPGSSFVANGAAQAADSALTTAAIEVRWKSGWSAAATFEGEFSNVTSSYAGKGVVRYVW